MDVLVGIPCMRSNDIVIRPAKHENRIGDSHIYTYKAHNNSSVCRAEVLRAPETPTTVWPGQFIDVDVPIYLPQSNDSFALETRTDHKPHDKWISPMLLTSVDGKVRVSNLTQFPQRRGKHEHFYQLRHTHIIENTDVNTSTYCYQTFYTL